MIFRLSNFLYIAGFRNRCHIEALSIFVNPSHSVDATAGDACNVLHKFIVSITVIQIVSNSVTISSREVKDNKVLGSLIVKVYARSVKG